MSLNAQAIAISGYGYGAQLMAVSGYGSVASEEVSNSGGFIHGYSGEKRRTKKDIEEARKEFGLVFEVIEAVALRQSEDLHLDSQQRFEELQRELTLKGLEFEAQYLEALNDRREQLISLEIGKLLKKRIQDEDGVLLMMIAMSL